MHCHSNDNEITAHDYNDKSLHNKLINNNNRTDNMLFLLSTALIPFAIQRFSNNDIASNSCSANDNTMSLLKKSIKFQIKNMHDESRARNVRSDNNTTTSEVIMSANKEESKGAERKSMFHNQRKLMLQRSLNTNSDNRKMNDKMSNLSKMINL